MKYKQKLKILEAVKDGGRFFDELLNIFLLPYGTPLSKALRRLDCCDDNDYKKINKKKLLNIDKNKRCRLSDMLYRLKKDGLIAIQDKNNQKTFSITEFGKETLLKLLSRKLLPNNQYKKEFEKEFKIIIFDIPEKEHRKRWWLRSVLKNLGFRILQKSVWIGKSKIPEELILDFKKLNILPYVEIFTIKKMGSLRHFKN